MPSFVMPVESYDISISFCKKLLKDWEKLTVRGNKHKMQKTASEKVGEDLQKQNEKDREEKARDKQIDEERKRQADLRAGVVKDQITASGGENINREAIREGLVQGRTVEELSREAREVVDDVIDQAHHHLQRVHKNLKAASVEPAIDDPDKMREELIDQAVIGELGIGSEGLEMAEKAKAHDWMHEELNNERLEELDAFGLVRKAAQGFSLKKKGSKAGVEVEDKEAA